MAGKFVDKLTDNASTDSYPFLDDSFAVLIHLNKNWQESDEAMLQLWSETGRFGSLGSEEIEFN